MMFALLHSPLVGPATWTALAPVLQARGHAVSVPDLTAAMREDGPYYPALAALAAAACGPGSILVAHSGAGALVPSVAALAPVKAVIFVDALLPHPGQSWFDGVPTELATRLRGLVKGGKLPPWHAWWPKGAMERLLPDRAQGAAFIAEQSELPLAYFDEAAPEVPLATPIAYLKLSDAYAVDADTAAAEQGWPVERLDLNHLSVLTEPGIVGDAMERLAGAIA